VGPANPPLGGAASGKPQWDPELDREERLQRLDALAMTGDSEALDAALVDPDRDVQTKALKILFAREGGQALDRVVALSRSEDSAAQLQALVLLNESGYADEATVLSAVGAAVGDKDRNVKEYAIQALAGRSGSQAMEHLRQASFDPDPNVRMKVLENVAQNGEGTALLRQALSDGDERVRTLAGFLLKQVTAAR
jgi:HEAT repeat protein